MQTMETVMSVITGSNAAKPDLISADLRQAMRDASMVPLWESPTAHKLDVAREQAHIWPWQVTRPILTKISEVSSPKVVERRVISLVKPCSKSAEDESTSGSVNATLQMLLPGERARPHRHSMNALRFVLEGSGAQTIVDGKPCDMLPGDLVITPAWCWHEHLSIGKEPTIWVDVLDVALHLFLGTDEFQPGPVHDAGPQIADQTFASPGILPSVDLIESSHSPIFRYSRADALKALEAAPVGQNGMRTIRYANPLSGQAAMSTLDCEMVEFGGVAPTRAFRTTASMVCVVVEGSGTSQIGEKSIGWEKNDVFTLPHGSWISHRASGDRARLFVVSNRDVYKRLGLLKETYRD